jgi:hypothetical protein
MMMIDIQFKNSKIMKKIFILLIILGFGVCWVGCSGSGNKQESKTDAERYHEACTEGDFDLARTILDKIHTNYNTNYSKGLVEDAEKYAGEYATGAKFVFGQEISYLATQDSANFKIKVVDVFNSIQTLGLKQDEYTPYESDDQIMDFDCYVLYVSLKNTLATQVVNYAIQYRDKDLAMMAFNQMEDNTSLKNYSELNQDEDMDKELKQTMKVYKMMMGESDETKVVSYSTEDKDKVLRMINSAFPK